MYLMQSSENTSVVNLCQGISNIMFDYTAGESKKGKGETNL